MKTSSRLKTVFLAAASLTAASAVIAHAAAAPPRAPVTIEHAAMTADADQNRAAPVNAAKYAGLAALGAATLAGLARLIGFTRIKAAVSIGAAAAGKAASAIGRAVASPFRFAAIILGLAIVAMTGVGLYDIEWAGGLIIGALLTATLVFGAGKLRKQLAPVRLGRFR